MLPLGALLGAVYAWMDGQAASQVLRQALHFFLIVYGAWALSRELDPDDPTVAFVGIVRDDRERAVRDYVAAEGIDWSVAMDPSARAALDFGTRGQPETFAISPEGVIAGAQIGPASVRDLETMLRAARGGPR